MGLVGTQIENTNGKTYEVLAEKGSYTLLADHRDDYPEYIVAWALHYSRDNQYTWGQGHYFWDLDEATDYLESKI
ncbi:hypothetical protein SDC9_119358 [bioreactor metagenome]|uniref:Uncharacterized protein n=1 Tax=bioreactor metagenome TaxID=1076179 RepID=A0A645C9F2_9ZZZZ